MRRSRPNSTTTPVAPAPLPLPRCSLDGFRAKRAVPLAEPVYRIKDWSTVFHLAEASRYGDVVWTKFPVSRNSVSYRRLMRTQQGRTAYCVFIGFVRLCARGQTGGVCAVKGKPITVEDIEGETGIPGREIAAAVKMLASSAVGWLVSNPTGIQRGDNGHSTGEPPLDKSRVDKSRVEQQQQHAAAPVAGGSFDEKVRYLTKKPEWLPEGRPWITRARAEEIAGLNLRQEQVDAVYSETRKSAKSLDNPAGYLISRLRAESRANDAAKIKLAGTA